MEIIENFIYNNFFNCGDLDEKLMHASGNRAKFTFSNRCIDRYTDRSWLGRFKKKVDIMYIFIP